MEILKQRRLWNQNVFEIEEKGLAIKSKKFSIYVELTVPFEDITRTSTIVKSGSKGWFISGTVFLIFAFVCLISRLIGEDIDYLSDVIWLVCAVICYGIYILKYQNIKNIMCTDGKAICFYLDKPNKDAFDSFINILFKRRKEFLKEKYTKIDLDFPLEQQLYRIKWLKDEEIINDSEYINLKTLIIEGKKEFNYLGFQTE